MEAHQDNIKKLTNDEGVIKTADLIVDQNAGVPLVAKLSYEQQRVVDYALGLNGHNRANVVVEAIAGAGKSNTLCAIGQMGSKINSHFKMLILVYNTKLQQDNQAAIKQMVAQGLIKPNQIVVKTYHSFINLQGGLKQGLIQNGFLESYECKNKYPDLHYYLDWMVQHNQSTRNDAGLIDWTNGYLKALEDVDFLKNWSPFIDHYDVVAFDEAQDLKPAYWNMAKMMIKIQNYQVLAQKQKQTTYLFVGDSQQTIYQHDGADARYLKLIEKLLPNLTWKRLSLSTSFRTSHKIAQFIQIFRPNEPFYAKQTSAPARAVELNIYNPIVVNKNHKHQNGSDEKLSKVFSHYKLLKQSANFDPIKTKQQLQRQLEIHYPEAFKIAKAIYQKIVVEKYQPKDVAVLTYVNVDKNSQMPMRMFLDEIRQILYGFFEILCGIDNHSTNQVHFETFHKAKGRQWPVVFVLGCSDYEVSQNERYHISNKCDLPNTHYVAFSRAKDFLSVNIINVYSNQYQNFNGLKTNILPPYMAKYWNHLIDLDNQDVVKITIGSLYQNRQHFFKTINKWANENRLNLIIDANTINIYQSDLINQMKALMLEPINLITSPFKIKMPTYMEGVYHQIDGNDKFKISDLLIFSMIANSQLAMKKLDHLVYDYRFWNLILMKMHNVNASGLNNIKSDLDFSVVIDFISNQSVLKQCQILLNQLVNENDLIWFADDQYWQALLSEIPELTILKEIQKQQPNQSRFMISSSLFNQLKGVDNHYELRWDEAQDFGLLMQAIIDFIKNQFWKETVWDCLKLIINLKIDYLNDEHLLVFVNSENDDDLNHQLEQAVFKIYLMLLHNELLQWAQSHRDLKLAQLINEGNHQEFKIVKQFKIVNLVNGQIWPFRCDLEVVKAIGYAWITSLIKNQFQSDDEVFINEHQELKTAFMIKNA